MAEDYAALSARQAEEARKNRDEHVKKQMADRDARRNAQNEVREAVMKGTPTPTQDENDRSALGEHIIEHADDGSGPDPFSPEQQAKRMEARPTGAPYQTRAATPAPPRTPRSE
jgi:hypothetical protein